MTEEERKIITEAARKKTEDVLTRMQADQLTASEKLLMTELSGFVILQGSKGVNPEICADFANLLRELVRFHGQMELIERISAQLDNKVSLEEAVFNLLEDLSKDKLSLLTRYTNIFELMVEKRKELEKGSAAGTA